MRKMILAIVLACVVTLLAFASASANPNQKKFFYPKSDMRDTKTAVQTSDQIEVAENYYLADGTILAINFPFPKNIYPINSYLLVYQFQYFKESDSYAWSFIGSNPSYLEAGIYGFIVLDNNTWGGRTLIGFNVSGTVDNPSHYLFKWCEVSESDIRKISFQSSENFLRGDIYLLADMGQQLKISVKDLVWMIETSDNYRDKLEVAGFMFPDSQGFPTLSVPKEQALMENRVLGHDKPFGVVMKWK